VAYVDAGHAWLVLVDTITNETMRRVDLGPATAL
jgi:hypothetical protein